MADVLPPDSLRRMTDCLLRFRDDRDWRQFHNPKDMAVSLCLEAAELLEHTQWRNGPALEQHLKEDAEAVGDELADVLGWVLLLAHDLHIDLPQAFDRKIAKNEAKYPVEKARGRANKYTDYK